MRPFFITWVFLRGAEIDISNVLFLSIFVSTVIETLRQQLDVQPFLVISLVDRCDGVQSLQYDHRKGSSSSHSFIAIAKGNPDIHTLWHYEVSIHDVVGSQHR